MTGDLLVIVPSRSRPGSIARMLDAVHATAKMRTHVHVAVDDDDPELERYQYVMGQAGRDGDTLTTGPRKGLCAWTNEIAVPAAGEYPFLASLGDDHVPYTPGWDKALIRAIAEMGGTGFAYPWDGTREDIPEAVVISSDIVTTLGWMCEPSLNHWYCVVPETPVLTADLHWVPIGKLTVGDELVGIDEWPTQARAERRFRRATVTAVPRRITECVSVELEDGREVTCSVEHRWLAERRWMGKGQQGPGRHEWRESGNLRPGDRLLSPLRTWDQETSFDAGWLSGIFDGEGTLSGKSAGGRNYGAMLSVAQNPGPVLDRIVAVLGAMDINYSGPVPNASGGRYSLSPDYRCQVVTITPRSAAMELVGRIQPVRLNKSLLWEDVPAKPRTRIHGVVKAIRPVGDAEVVSMATSTGTYLANGLVAHNCDNVWADLGRGAGCLRHLRAVKVEHAWKGDQTSRDSSGKLAADRAAYWAWRRSPRLEQDTGTVIALREARVPQPA